MEKTYKVGNYGEISLSINEISPKYQPQDLFTMGLRHNNPKRSFLFVSKVLGKHIPITPNTLLEALQELVSIWCKKNFNCSPEEYSVPTLVIGFAETATAMGHGFFSYISRSSTYLHSTREEPQGVESLFYACEEHSHAMDHNFFLQNRDILKKIKHIVIVDDEITTGKTALNLIKAIDEIFPGKEYSVASFLDWRNDEHRKMFIKGINEREIKTASILSGTITKNSLTSPDHSHGIPYEKMSEEAILWETISLGFTLSCFFEGKRNFIQYTGRFGLDNNEQILLEKELEKAAYIIQKYRNGKKTLFLGHGECMYIPLRLAKLAGEDISFHATTRSPAWPSSDLNPYGIINGITFNALDNKGYNEFVYNIAGHEYDELFLVTESSLTKESLEPFMKLVSGAGITNIKHIILGK